MKEEPTRVFVDREEVLREMEAKLAGQRLGMWLMFFLGVLCSAGLIFGHMDSFGSLGGYIDWLHTCWGQRDPRDFWSLAAGAFLLAIWRAKGRGLSPTQKMNMRRPQ